MSNLAEFIEAAAFAAKNHSSQKRKDDISPYINHPLEVAELLTTIGKIEDSDVLIAAVLHDTLEDTETTEEEIARLFGREVCKIVIELTDDKSLPEAERKQKQVDHAPHLSYAAKIVKLGDKISNIREIIHNPPAEWSVELRREYIEWGVKVVAGLRGANENLEAHFDGLVEKGRQALSENATSGS